MQLGAKGIHRNEVDRSAEKVLEVKLDAEKLSGGGWAFKRN
jgi:hypothetical protein